MLFALLTWLQLAPSMLETAEAPLVNVVSYVQAHMRALWSSSGSSLQALGQTWLPPRMTRFWRRSWLCRLSCCSR